MKRCFSDKLWKKLLMLPEISKKEIKFLYFHMRVEALLLLKIGRMNLPTLKFWQLNIREERTG
jgi:hypothetical protein